jgi:hypothetical protein
MNGEATLAVSSHKGPEKELRLALAMRGGVSLAVWMGGACSEVDQLRRTCPGDVTPYGRLLEAAGYDSAVVDVIAGASAGGLNGVLMASSVVYGSVFDQKVRNLWLRLGDLSNLMRPVFGRRPQSLLNGDGYFYAVPRTTRCSPNPFRQAQRTTSICLTWSACARSAEKK